MFRVTAAVVAAAWTTLSTAAPRAPDGTSTAPEPSPLAASSPGTTSGTVGLGHAMADAAAPVGATRAGGERDETECIVSERSALESRLLDAMRSGDEEAVEAVVAAARRAFGAPRPERRTEYRRVDPANVDPRLSEADLSALAERYLRAVDEARWWRRGVRPNEAPFPLRESAGSLRGALAVADAFPEHRAVALSLAEDIGTFLVEASEVSGFAGAPFPYWRGRPGRLGELSEGMARRLERCGALERSVVGGWFVVREVPWEYYFDTGRVGEALAALQRRDADPDRSAWLEGAIAWSLERAPASNFNYNAFTVDFLVEAAALDDEPGAARLLAARERASIGVVSGLYRHGPHAGHWVDPHNERTVYRAIMARALVRLAGALAAAPSDDASRNRSVTEAAAASVAALEREMIDAGGVAHPEEMVELYLDLDAAREAGATLPPPDAGVREAVFALALSRVSRGAPGHSAAAGRLIAALRERRRR